VEKLLLLILKGKSFLKKLRQTEMCSRPMNKDDLKDHTEKIKSHAQNLLDIIDNYKVLDIQLLTDIMKMIELNTKMAQLDIEDIQYERDAGTH
jgi:hypothetical protein